MIGIDATVRLLRQADLFKNVEAGVLADVLLSATEREVMPGDTVVEEDELGDTFFVVVDGTLLVVGRAFDGTELSIARLGPGQVFGEQALTGAEPVRRNASVRALTRCHLLVFPRDALMRLQREDVDLPCRLGILGQRQGSWRQSLFRDAVLNGLGIGADYTVEHVPRDTFVFRQGESGDRVYLIISGAAEVLQRDGGLEQRLADLRPGQFFGELAVLNNQPRTASVRATADLELACLDGAWLRAAVSTNPRLRSIFGALQAMYLLPARGLLTLQGGKLGSEPTLTATHHLADGRRVVSTRLTEMDAFIARVADASEASATAVYRPADGTGIRVIHIADGRLVELESEGPWERLGHTFAALLDGEPIGPDDLASFRTTGDFGSVPVPDRAADEVICRCMGITAGQITAAIQSGCGSLTAVATRTTATLVCGGCAPVVREFLGEGEWLPGVCEGAQSLSSNVRAFRLKWLREAPYRHRPGQHVVVQGRIGGRWVERPYTLSAPLTDCAGEIIVKLDPSGTMSPWLFGQLAPGTALRLSPPRGTFLLDLDRDAPVVFLAGGIGITPALALVRHLTSNPPARGETNRFHIDYSERADESFICRTELSDLAARHPWLSVNLRNTRRTARFTSMDATALLAELGDETLFVLCGSDPYVLGTRASLSDSGIDAARILSESFTPVAPEARRPEASMA